MAVDSRQKRTSMIASSRRLPWLRRFTLPVPDSSVETPDRAQLASIYSGLIASELPEPSFGGGGGGMLLTGVGGGGGFNPLSFSPTLLALPSRSFSDNGVTPAVNDDPTYLVDDATANNIDPTQTVLASRPIYKTAGYWQFDGTNDHFTTSSVTRGAEYTLVAVVKLTDDTGVENICDASSHFQFRWNDTSCQLLANNDVSTTFTASTTGTPSDWNVIIGRVSGTNINVFVNGGTPGTATITGTPASGTGALIMGRWSGGAFQYLAGQLRYLFVKLNGALTNEQLNQFCSPLASSYGISWTNIT